MILASNNAHKLEEFRAIFADMGIEIIPQSAAGCHFEVDETGETFEENAYLKAIAVTRATGQPAVADDSGLMVDALGGAPACTRRVIPAGMRTRTLRAIRSCSITSATAPTARARVRVVHLLHVPERGCPARTRHLRGQHPVRPGAGKTASATTPCSSRTAMPAPWRNCARKRKTPFPTAGMRSKS